MKKMLLSGFIVMATVQWCVPAYMIIKKQKTVTAGRLYKFEVTPVDPADPFRGRYINLQFKENFFTTSNSQPYSYGDKVYVRLSVSKEGFARISDISDKKPADKHYIAAAITYTTVNNDSTRLYIRYPFEKFYMDEYQAPAAESVYQEQGNDSTQKAYALVNILNGDAVIKDVLVNDSSIHDIIRHRYSK